MEELTGYKNWVVTYPHDKIPLNPYTGKRADVNDPLTWGDFGTADACVSFNKHLTLGFVLTQTPYSCIDLDTYKTKNPVIIDYHRQLYEAFHTYSELSPNGGVHLWCVAKLGIDGKRLPQQFVEVYCNKRYMTVTRQSLNGSRIEERQKYLEQFVTWSSQQVQAQLAQFTSAPEVASDIEVCTMAANAFNGELFRELYLGNWHTRYPSQSEADQALVNIIAFYTDSKDQVGRIFHNSELGKRKKAHRQSYLYDPKYGIITRAFDQKLPNVYFKDIQDIVASKVHEEALKAIAAPVPGFTTTPRNPDLVKAIQKLPEFVKEELDIKFDDFPVGLMGDIAKFIYRNSVRPVKEIAIAGAIALMAGICGKFYNISEMGLNHYIAILAPTGSGKEGASSGINRLVNYVSEKFPTIGVFIGPDQIASPQALVRHLAEPNCSCCVSRKGEMGLWIQKICARHTNDNNIGLRETLLSLYTTSGKGKIYRETIRADKGKDTPAIKSPAFSLYGDSTPEVFYAALDENQLDQGLISRFTVIECGPDPEYMFNPLHDKIEPDPNLIERIAGMAKHVLAGHEASMTMDIDMTPEAAKCLDAFRVECDAKLLDNQDSAEAKVYTRGYERLLRLAGLVAVGVDPNYPIVTLDIAVWAKKFILRSMINVILKFERGEVGESNLYLEQRAAMIQIIRHYWKVGWKDSYLEQFNISKEMYEWKIITRNYLNNKIRGYAAFRKARNMKLDFDNACMDLVKNGAIVGIEMGKIRESLRTGIAYYIHDVTLLKE
jgi:hypothetical protein